MGMKELIQKSVSSAFSALGDLVDTTNLNYKQVTGSSYNPVTGINDITYAETSFNGVIVNISEIERAQAGVTPKAFKVICQQEEFDFQPSENDVIDYQSIDWQITSIIADPADATYTFSLDVS